jgi:RNA-directed DNA polymerase
LPPFNVTTKAELAKLLCVLPQEIDEVIKNRGRHYRIQRTPKADGSQRILNVPEGPIRLLQDKIKRHIFDAVGLLDCVHGGVRGRSPVTNASPHVGKRVVFALDVKDCFPNIGPNSVAAIFGAIGFGAEVLPSLVQATIWNMQLPQGGPTSVALANLALYRVDRRVTSLARQNGFAYTRYVDDLSLSGSLRLLDFRSLIQRIVEEEGFTVNVAKIKTMGSGSRQTVTGIVVNDRLNLPREKQTSIRRQVASAAVRCERSPIAIRSVYGQLSWLSAVNREKAARLRRRVPVLKY